MQLNQFFKDLKVLELASVLAGPAVGMFFAELGAEVIKVENKTTQGDVTRGWKLSGESRQRDYSAYYCSVNWHKTVKMMNLKSEIDREELYEMVKTADVVVANYRPGSAARMGVDYESIKKINPRIIYANLTSFEPSSTRPAFDIVLQAETGFLYMTGAAGQPPVRMPVALIDLAAAHQLKEGILIALLHRERTGEGALVTASLYESAIASLANQATNWLMEKHIPQRMGSEHPNIAPYGDVFSTKDERLLVLAIGTEKHFKNLCRVLKEDQLTADAKFSTNKARVVNRKELNTVLKKAIASFDAQDLMQQLLEADVPAGLIRNMKEVFENPLAEQMVLEEQQSDGTMSRRVQTVAFKIT